MAGTVQSSARKSLAFDSPKGKQSSILSFFNNQTPTNSDLAPSSLSLCAVATADDILCSDNVENETTLNNTPKIPTLNLKEYTEKNTSGLLTPRILTEAYESTDLKDWDNSGEVAVDRYEWLVNVRDGKGRSPDHPEYDCRTLYIPESQWAKFSPFERQFWEVKSKLFDAVVFFKKGKFYELYENDADIGAREFNLKTTDRVNMRMAGVPEATFDFWATRFVGKGYKIAKVDQLENAVSKGMREKSEKSRSEKIIRRELSSILTCGTLVDGAHLKTDNSNFCLALKFESADAGSYSIGAAFLDASSAKFSYANFMDDETFTILNTLLSQICPREILIEKRPNSMNVQKILRRACPTSSFVILEPIKEFWDVAKSDSELRAARYHGSTDVMPLGLCSLLAGNSASISAFGALISYLRTLKLDEELLSYGDVSYYDVMEEAKTLILDAQALEHLNICGLGNESQQTLLGIIDRTSTPFGRRLMCKWILHPLADYEQLKTRQATVNDLINSPGLLQDISRFLKSVPDLERLCTRIHAKTISIKSFVAVLNGLKLVSEFVERFSNNPAISPSSEVYGLISSMPGFANTLDEFFSSFDQRAAVNEGVVILCPGQCPELDRAKATISDYESRFEEYLISQQKKLRCNQLKYRDIGKEIYQIEVPSNFPVPDDYMVLSKTKAVRRYWTPELKRMVTAYLESKEALAMIQSSAQVGIYERFNKNKHVWKSVIDKVAQIDCLHGLAAFSLALPGPKCCPSVQNDEFSFLKIKTLRHPIVAGFRPEGFVSNDLVLSNVENGKHGIILTGANMGGKSTFLRQVGLAVVLAQIGAWIPAEAMSLTLFDRIFTRLGANDNIIGGESTFKVELSETAKALTQATSRSLVLMDELGRGTSTYDGVAIAESVLLYLIEKIRCCTIFSTHYNMLCDTFANHPSISFNYMSCVVDEEKKIVTFLYRLAEGVSPKSYGIHVAHMAGLPDAIIQSAANYTPYVVQADSICDSSKYISEKIFRHHLADLN